MQSKRRILLVEDSAFDAAFLVLFLKNENVDFSHFRVWNKLDFITALNENEYDLIISDQDMPGFSGMEAFRIAKNTNKNMPFILVTGTVSETLLTEFAKEGVDDYILKENLLRLPFAIEKVISKKKIKELHDKLEIAHKDIKDSINYAKKIQNAMLPDAALLNENFAKSFIFFKPKDILSGDFYWLKKEGNSFLIAVADCTGHGIPGALMSMVGIEKLNHAAIKSKKPSEMLKQLNESMEIALAQSALYEQCNDGMDVSLCCIDKENKNLKFSGANRPLWIIRNGETEVEEIKGTKKAIGGLSMGLSPNYDSQEIKLQKGDTFYMFSDGFADQFGGEKNKKLTSKRFKKLLIDIQPFTMKQQEKHLNNFFENWKSEAEQVDDILVIGVRQE